MRVIDLETWPRREHFKKFIGWDYPHFNLCANMELTDFLPAIKKSGVSVTIGIVYAISRAANSVAEFRCRIRGEQVVEHELVHPSFTVLAADDLFSFCMIDYCDDFGRFAELARVRIAESKRAPILTDEPGRDDLLFMTALPWVAFTSFMHPIHLSPADSFPRFAWGKIFQDEGGWKMPLSVQAHHSLMDGIHMARFYERLQGLLSRPSYLSG